MNYVSADDIVSIHDDIVENIGGSLGIREPGMLASIAEKPKTSFGAEELYPDIFTKAASLYEGLCNYHVFIDGNKRTAALVMYRFLNINGYDLTASNKQLEEYTLFIATNNPDIVEVAIWIKKHSKKASK
ncbi:type II toxin-antitoxin system death-on-curing family toxin [Candidatus Parcubacteria bacterium]|nr:type II toxin-antitoxin system death-on-curing family toxin [Candidatus Parcubacteria bacterium]